MRAGVLPTAFGSFLLRYDDASNPLIDMPPQYGYYYSAVTTAGLPGAQIDVTRSKVDARLQFANSSPANPRSLFARDQYGNWAGGAGYTLRQGLRVGVDAYRGPISAAISLTSSLAKAIPALSPPPVSAWMPSGRAVTPAFSLRKTISSCPTQ